VSAITPAALLDETIDGALRFPTPAGDEADLALHGARRLSLSSPCPTSYSTSTPAQREAFRGTPRMKVGAFYKAQGGRDQLASKPVPIGRRPRRD